MKKLNKKIKLYSFAAIAAVLFLAACNKGLEQLAPVNTTVPTNPIVGTIAQVIASNPNDSLFYKLLQRSTLLPLLNDSNKRFTIFAVDNAGMKIFVNAASGGAVPLNAPDAVFAGFISNSLPITSAAGIVQYNIIGQQQYFPSSWATAFPNLPLPSLIQLDPVNTPFLRMTICPSINNGINYVNNVPVFNPALQASASNGVIHHSYTIAAPPTKLLKELIAAESTLKFFRSAILRADVGQIVKPNLDSTNFFNFLLGYGVLNLTILTPNDAAMQPVLKGILTQAYVGFGYSLFSADSLANLKSSVDSLNSPTAGFNILPPANVRGLLAYHILATDTGSKCKPNIRVFSVNIPTAPTFIKTLVNSAPFPAVLHPGILATATFAGPSTSAISFTGFKPSGTSAIPSGPPANVVKKDNHAVNGIYHIIDRVLLPQ